ncbi:hypothetical protein L6R29_17640 [Myxococcota bacterium]|nr:hypothetical protein [Myxococcota bacterium]
MQARTFHGTNVWLFVMCLLWVWLLGRRMGLGRGWAWVGVGMVGLHPLCVEPVAWVSGRKDLLYGLCVLLALWGADRALEVWRRAGEGRGERGKEKGERGKEKGERGKEGKEKKGKSSRVLGEEGEASEVSGEGRGWMWWVGVWSVGALLSKGAGVVVVPMLGGWWWWRGRELWRRWWKGYAVVVVMAGCWVSWTLWVGVRNQIVEVGGAVGDPLWRRLFHALGMPLWSVVRWLLPWDLSPSYEGRFLYESWWMDPWPWLGVLVLGGMLWAGRSGAKMPMLWVFVVGLACVLLPYVGILRVNQHHADRFLLLVVVVCAWGGAMLLERMAVKVKWLGWAVLPALLAWGMETHRYVGAWESDVALWLYVYRQDPRHIGATTNLGAIAVQRGRFEEAEKLLRVAVEVAPLRPQGWNSLGLVCLYRAWDLPKGSAERESHLKRAEELFLRVLGMVGGDKSVTPLWGLGHIERMRGRLGEAEKYWRKGLWLPKVSSRLVLDLAELWVSQGREEDAKRLVMRMRGRFARQEKIEAWLKKHQGKR